MAVGRRRTDPTEVAPSLAEGFDGDGHGDARTDARSKAPYTGSAGWPLPAHRLRGGRPGRPATAAGMDPRWGNPRRATAAARVRRAGGNAEVPPGARARARAGHSAPNAGRAAADPRASGIPACQGPGALPCAPHGPTAARSAGDRRSAVDRPPGRLFRGLRRSGYATACPADGQRVGHGGDREGHTRRGDQHQREPLPAFRCERPAHCPQLLSPGADPGSFTSIQLRPEPRHMGRPARTSPGSGPHRPSAEGTAAGGVPSVPALRGCPAAGPKGPHWGLAARGPRGPTGTVWNQRRCHGESSPGPRTSQGNGSV